MKQCSRCKEWKEEVEYGKLKSSKDGLTKRKRIKTTDYKEGLLSHQCSF